jgi:signal transduction histidine kinase
MDSRNFAVQYAPIDVRRMVSWSVENCTPIANDQTVDVDVEPDLPALHGDEVLLRIALTNLLSNAFKYSPEGTTVGLRVRRDGAMCRFTVEDCGAGIPDEEATLIFQKYRRGRGAEGKPGAGLGLALVQRIANLHGGSVSVARRELQGTRFALSIPFETQTQAEPAQP